MSCRELRASLIELARERLGPELEKVRAHANVCVECGLFLEEQLALTATMMELRAEIPAMAPVGLEDILLAKLVPARAQRAVWRKTAGIASIAASFALAATALAWFMAGPVRAPRQIAGLQAARPDYAPVAIAPPSEPVVNAVPPRKLGRKTVLKHSPDPAAEEPFVALPYTLPLDPREQARVIRMEMPVSALAAVGLAVALPDPRASAQTDVLVGEDGRIRAIRLISISSSSISNADRRMK